MSKTELQTSRDALRAISRILDLWRDGDTDAATARHAIRAAVAGVRPVDTDTEPPGSFEAVFDLGVIVDREALQDFLAALPGKARLGVPHDSGVLKASWGTVDR